jgi:hypothetical protein
MKTAPVKGPLCGADHPQPRLPCIDDPVADARATCHLVEQACRPPLGGGLSVLSPCSLPVVTVVQAADRWPRQSVQMLCTPGQVPASAQQVSSAPAGSASPSAIAKRFGIDPFQD